MAYRYPPVPKLHHVCTAYISYIATRGTDGAYMLRLVSQQLELPAALQNSLPRRASSRICSAALLVGYLALGHGHGYMTWPPSRQLHGRSGMAMGGDCVDTITCSWFSQPAYIPNEPTLNAAPLRTMNVDVAGGDTDWSRRHPWRSPGAAPVSGSGCGSAGGGPVPYRNHGMAPRNGPPQGTDGVTLPVGAEVTTWRRGSEQEVAWAISAK